MNRNENDIGLEPRIMATIANVFRIPVDTVSPSASMGELPAWDSMGHMELIVTLEREFGVTFPTYRLPDLVTVAAIVEALRELGLGGGAS